jgi:hypothetical protein
LSALALVLALTALAGQLGAKLSGLLAPFPVVASVLAVFTHTLHGEQDLLRIMRGFVVGLVAYALFCFVLAVSLQPLGIAESFVLAAAVALMTQALALSLTWLAQERSLQSDRSEAQDSGGTPPQTAATGSPVPGEAPELS